MNQRDRSGSPADRQQQRVHRRRQLAALLSGKMPIAWRMPPGDWTDAPVPVPRGVLSGSFNPLHVGHIELRRIAESMLKGPVAYELPLVNADKPALSLEEAVVRVEQQFDAPVAVTTAPVFLQKARLMPGVTFVVGADTAARVVDARFYPYASDGVAEALAEFRNLNCQFLVAARFQEGALLTAENIGVPAESADLFAPVPEHVFRRDVSSSYLRDHDRTPASE